MVPKAANEKELFGPSGRRFWGLESVREGIRQRGWVGDKEEQAGWHIREPALPL